VSLPLNIADRYRSHSLVAALSCLTFAGKSVRDFSDRLRLRNLRHLQVSSRCNPAFVPARRRAICGASTGAMAICGRPSCSGPDRSRSHKAETSANYAMKRGLFRHMSNNQPICLVILGAMWIVDLALLIVGSPFETDGVGPENQRTVRKSRGFKLTRLDLKSGAARSEKSSGGRSDSRGVAQ